MLISYDNFDCTSYDADAHLRFRVLCLRGAREGSRGLRNGALWLLGCDLSRPGKEPRHHQAEDETADVREERDADKAGYAQMPTWACTRPEAAASASAAWSRSAWSA